ncbi:MULTISPECIES: ThiF family adenylyltransferase [Nonomuraea]|uniref:ThiF family adenylyltransferase n=1 Tax=Nonomuraea ferruginea TaxID=46174 RepID=A0ABT4T1A9_9ACTN|nr:ThiF family adenylyltransferase [Nonomuraea ferruginea]MDA0643298.1 ThiF family adenylyltransferase [Nonomuraea ferruginea]
MRKPRLKHVHLPTVFPDGRIRISLGQYGVATELQDDAEGSIARILTLMDGTRDIEQICADFVADSPEVERENVREIVEALISEGFIEDAEAEPPANLSARELERYARARHFYSWIDTVPRESPYTVQSKIKQAKVGLLGVGGTGSAVAAGLVASGIGALHLADFDDVQESNLTRQLLYTEQDIGESKVERAVARLRAMNSLVKVTGSELKATGTDDIAALMADCDVFVLCADEPDPDIKIWTNEAALRTGTPWFVSFYGGPMAVVGSFHPGETGCWRCMRGDEDRKKQATGQRDLITHESWPNAVIAASANISGHLCALEIIYHLGGLSTQARGRMFHWNFAVWDHVYAVDVVRQDDCPACGPAGG